MIYLAATATVLALWPIVAIWLASWEDEPRTSYDHGTRKS